LGKKGFHFQTPGFEKIKPPPLRGGDPHIWGKKGFFSVFLNWGRFIWDPREAFSMQKGIGGVLLLLKI
jgi:hypothetical protein